MKSLMLYMHHGKLVTVYSFLKGRHKEACLCYDCGAFQPEDREKNCPIANAVYNLNVEHGLVTPVWECPEFYRKDRPFVAEE